jgi:hypothetical protein
MATTPEPTSTENQPKARPSEKPDELTRDTSQTGSCGEYGKTNYAAGISPSPKSLDKGASDSPCVRLP